MKIAGLPQQRKLRQGKKRVVAFSYRTGYWMVDIGNCMNDSCKLKTCLVSTGFNKKSSFIFRFFA